jgi:IS1 family transposase
VEADKPGTIQAHLKTAVDGKEGNSKQRAASSQPEALLLHLNGSVPVAKDSTPVIDIQSVAARDTNDLQKLVDVAKGLDESKYTPESWKQLVKALADANDVLADASSTNQQINAAYNALNTAINGLVKISAKVDKSKLQSLHDSSQSLDSKDYTTDSWSAFATAMKQAEQVLTDGNATQEQVNSAYAALLKAQQLLVRTSANPAADTSNGNSAASASRKPKSGHLSSTGAAVGGVALIALMAVVAGTVFMLLRKRR